jgi:hypothetical protein
MAIVGHHPEHGVRVVVERRRADGPPWRYEGEATARSAAYRLTATVLAGGEVTVDLDESAPAGLVDRVRLIVRAAYKHAKEEGTEPPRRISRWRAHR